MKSVLEMVVELAIKQMEREEEGDVEEDVASPVYCRHCGGSGYAPHPVEPDSDACVWVWCQTCRGYGRLT